MLTTTEQEKDNKRVSIDSNYQSKSALKKRHDSEAETGGDVSDISGGHIFEFKNVQEREKVPESKTKALT